MLSLDHVEVAYLNVIMVLRGVTMEVGDGKIVALLGANGAGKSTTLKAISGLLRTEQGKIVDGTVQFDGHRLDRMGPEDITRLGIVQVLEGRRIFPQLSCEENVKVGAFGASGSTNIRSDLEMVYEYFPRLRYVRNQTSGYVSGGEQQMAVMGRALLSHPRVLLLDEP